MIWLLLSILCFTGVMICFRFFTSFKVHTFQAIVINYITAASVGFILIREEINPHHILLAPWFPNAFLIGLMFIFLFYMIAITAQQLGVSVSAVANKMSVVIPVVAAYYLYNDSLGIIKIMGIILALGGVWMTTVKEGMKKRPWQFYLLPLILFIGSGLLDTYIKYTEEHLLSAQDISFFIPTAFTVAGIVGFIVITIRFFMRPSRFVPASIPWGILVGILNYASMFFLLLTLKIDDAESSVVFPLSNVGVVLAGTIASYFIFRERLTRLNWLGIICCSVAIILIAAA